MIHVEELLRDPAVWEYRIIPTAQIPFAQAVADACKANSCGKYGSCWTCPPGVGHYTQWQQRILQFRTAVVFTCKHPLEDCFDFEGMIEGQRRTMDVLYRMQDQLRQSGLPHLPLGCAGCSLCADCTYPDNPCRFPDRATVSVEACGIDVVKLSRDTGLRYHNGPDTVTYFCIIVL
jgi:predicted metal-binding protein